MKTVMKKMFCLLLVAVLLVGAMPTAFADGANTVHINVVVNGNVDAGNFSATFDEAPDLSSLKAQAEGYVGTFTGASFSGWTEMGGSPIGAADIQNGWTIKANFTAPYCSPCGQYGHSTSESHCECGYYIGHRDSCTVGCKNDYSCTWTFAHHSTCTYNKCEICNNAKHAGSCCSICFQQDGVHSSECTSGCTKAAGCDWTKKHASDCVSQHVCSVCNTKGHLEKDCGQIIETCCGVQKGSAHRSDCVTNCKNSRTCTNANHVSGCPYADCDVEGCTKKDAEAHTVHPGAACEVSGCTMDKGHTGDHSNVCATCLKPKMKSPEHNANCSYYYLNAEPSNTGDALVRVHVRLHNGTTLINTVELLTYRDDKGTQIGDSVSAHKSMILAELAEEYPEYSWGGNLYDDPGDSQDYNEKIGTGTTVYINAYAGQDMVLVYVHNGRTFSNLRIIQLEGKRRGDTVTKKEVTAAVSKYFNVSSLSMYSEDAWEDYVDGEKVESVSSLKIPADDSYYVIDVKISGTAKGGTSGTGYSADSSNPKTGDDIFAPVMVLGLSASALAVLFYLNKKRAY